MIITSLVLFSGCARQVNLKKPLPVISQDNIQVMQENFNLYTLQTFKSIDAFKKKVENKIMGLQQSSNTDINNAFIYYK